MNEPSPKRSAPFVMVVLANLALLLAGCLLLELFFGNWLRPNRINRLNVIRDATFHHDVRALYPTNEPVITYTRDAYGLRGKRSDDGHVDLLTMGGSTTDQRFIADGKTWQDVLHDDFLKNGKSISIVNAGVDGQSTVGMIKDFDWWFPFIPNFKTKYVLLYVGVNDFFVHEKFDDLVKPDSFVTRIKESSAVVALLRKVKGIYQAQHVSKLGHTAVDFSKLKWISTPRNPHPEKLMTSTAQEYAKRLQLLLQKTAALPAVPICVTQPARYYKKDSRQILGVEEDIAFGKMAVNGVDYFKMMQVLHETTIRVCRENKAVVIDLAGELPFDDSDFYDLVHNNPRGTEKIGHYLYEKLGPVLN